LVDQQSRHVEPPSQSNSRRRILVVKSVLIVLDRLARCFACFFLTTSDAAIGSVDNARSHLAPWMYVGQSGFNMCDSYQSPSG
jgi:hypothetical protein